MKLSSKQVRSLAQKISRKKRGLNQKPLEIRYISVLLRKKGSKNTVWKCRVVIVAE